MANKNYFQYIKLIAIFVFSIMGSYCFAQNNIVISGVVKDSVTNLPIANASIYFDNQSGAVSNPIGKFTIKLNKSKINNQPLLCTYVGYNKYSKVLVTQADTLTDVIIYLVPKSNDLKEVVVRKQKEKYRNKNNPAVELIKMIVAHRDENRMATYNTASYHEYEKMSLSASNFPEKLQNGKALRKYGFLFKNVDTTKVKGQRLLPVYIDEKSSENYIDNQLKKSKQIVIGRKKVDFGEYFDTKGIDRYLSTLYANIDIYDNNIDLFSNQFLSPIANAAPSFYKYRIIDTIAKEGAKLIHLSFMPRNNANMLFRGTLYVTLDGRYAIQKVDLFSPIGINLNFLKSFQIRLDYTKQVDGKYLLSQSDLLASFGISKNGLGIYSERLVAYSDFKINAPIPPAMFMGDAIVVQDSALNKSTAYWAKNRVDTLSEAESKVIENIDSLKKMKSFRNAMDWLTVLSAGYKQAGPVEIGPINSFYSFNDLEGARVRLGARTTPKFNKSLYLDAYGAYGFEDKEWKYDGGMTYSFTHQPTYHFPQHFIRAEFQHDVKIPGQELQFVSEDNFFSSLKRGINDKYTYNDIFSLNYTKEYASHFSYSVQFKNWTQTPADKLLFDYPTKWSEQRKSMSNITTSQIGIDLRYAPHEVFYENEAYRVPLVNKYPIFELRYLLGLKDFLGGTYNYQNIQANIFKRFYLSQFGYTDITVDAGYIVGKLPFPLLNLGRANQSYAYELGSFNLMNYMEFVNDHYVSIMADHYFNGYILNKIPLIKKLKWRSVVEGKLLYGGLRNENNPAYNNDQLAFPVTDGSTSSFAMTNEPYFEAGFGITNIFKVLRVDYVRRFSYLNHSHIAKSGIRLRFKFNF